jgi:hypothetical protein
MITIIIIIIIIMTIIMTIMTTIMIITIAFADIVTMTKAAHICGAYLRALWAH